MEGVIAQLDISRLRRGGAEDQAQIEGGGIGAMYTYVDELAHMFPLESSNTPHTGFPF